MSSPTQHIAEINALGLEAYITHSFSLLSVQNSEFSAWNGCRLGAGFHKDSLRLIHK